MKDQSETIFVSPHMLIIMGFQSVFFLFYPFIRIKSAVRFHKLKRFLLQFLDIRHRIGGRPFFAHLFGEQLRYHKKPCQQLIFAVNAKTENIVGGIYIS